MVLVTEPLPIVGKRANVVVGLLIKKRHIFRHCHTACMVCEMGLLHVLPQLTNLRICITPSLLRQCFVMETPRTSVALETIEVIHTVSISFIFCRVGEEMLLSVTRRLMAMTQIRQSSDCFYATVDNGNPFNLVYIIVSAKQA